LFMGHNTTVPPFQPARRRHFDPGPRSLACRVNGTEPSSRGISGMPRRNGPSLRGDLGWGRAILGSPGCRGPCWRGRSRRHGAACAGWALSSGSGGGQRDEVGKTIVVNPSSVPPMERLRNLIAVRIAPGNHGIHVPTFAFEDYVVASIEPAIFTRCPTIAPRAPQPRKCPAPKFTDTLSSEPCPQSTP
jgi:hypothetical protein